MNVTLKSRLKGIKYFCFYYQVWPVIKYFSGELTTPCCFFPETDDSDTGEKLHSPKCCVILIKAQLRTPPCTTRSSLSIIKLSWKCQAGSEQQRDIDHRDKFSNSNFKPILPEGSWIPETVTSATPSFCFFSQFWAELYPGSLNSPFE